MIDKSRPRGAAATAPEFLPAPRASARLDAAAKEFSDGMSPRTRALYDQFHRALEEDCQAQP